MSSPSTGNTVNLSNPSWHSLGPEYSPRSNDKSRTPSLDLEPNFQTLKLDQISSTKETEKRRQQNRNSQIAHRQRNKRMMEDLRQEVTDFSEYSQDMYQTLQSLRETTKALVLTLDQALSMRPPERNDFTKERKHSSYSGCQGRLKGT
jgi:bZIP transcription factor